MWGYTADWMLSRNGDNYVTRYINRFYPVRQDECTKTKAITGNKQHSLALARSKDTCQFLWFGNVLFLPVLKHDCAVVLSLSCSTTVRERPCLMLTSCEPCSAGEPQTSCERKANSSQAQARSTTPDPGAQSQKLSTCKQFLPETRADKLGNTVFLSFFSNRIQIRLLQYSAKAEPISCSPLLRPPKYFLCVLTVFSTFSLTSVSTRVISVSIKMLQSSVPLKQSLFVKCTFMCLFQM